LKVVAFVSTSTFVTKLPLLASDVAVAGATKVPARTFAQGGVVAAVAHDITVLETKTMSPVVVNWAFVVVPVGLIANVREAASAGPTGAKTAKPSETIAVATTARKPSFVRDLKFTEFHQQSSSDRGALRHLLLLFKFS
jgi:hypothetical protein